jgi:hypothetical protein
MEGILRALPALPKVSFRSAAALSLWAIVTPASATIIDVTYSGIVSNGTDATGVFGPADVLLNGNFYTLVYTFDTAMGRFSNGAGLGAPDATGSELVGGPGAGPAIHNLYSSPGFAVLTINGQSVNFTVDSGTNSQGTSTSCSRKIRAWEVVCSRVHPIE